MEIPSNERQIIIYGAPGTGKSHFIKQKLEPESEKEKKNFPKENQFRTTFHPDSDYSTFVGAYKPTMVDNNIQYKFVPQVFLKAYEQAYNVPEQNVYLVIEEINRGNCAQIFGDIFQLLDRNDKGSSEYEIDADEDIKAYLEEALGKDSEGIKGGKLSLPSNLYIYATMNTSDQSLFPIDSAFKRRWYWVYSPIKYGNDWDIKKYGNDWDIKIDKYHTYSWTSFQKVVNGKIFAATNSEDKMLGDFFVKPNGNEISKEMFRDKVLFYLWNDVCKDGSGDIFVIKADNKTETDNTTKKVSFSDFYMDDGDKKLIAIMEHLGVEKKSLGNIELGSDDNDAGTNGSKNKDKYEFNRNGHRYGPYFKAKLLVELIQKYLAEHQNIPAEEFWNSWKFVNKKLGDYAIVTDEDYNEEYEGKAYQFKEQKIGDKTYHINISMWNPDTIGKLIDEVNKRTELGFSIEKSKQS